MKKAIALLLTIGSTIAFANDHISFENGTAEMADKDSCIHVAVDAVIVRMVNDYVKENPNSDPSDMDMAYITAIKLVKGQTYKISAAANSPDSPRTYTVAAKCTATIKAVSKK